MVRKIKIVDIVAPPPEASTTAVEDEPVETIEPAETSEPEVITAEVSADPEEPSPAPEEPPPKKEPAKRAPRVRIKKEPPQVIPIPEAQPEEPPPVAPVKKPRAKPKPKPKQPQGEGGPPSPPEPPTQANGGIIPPGLEAPYKGQKDIEETPEQFWRRTLKDMKDKKKSQYKNLCSNAF